MNCFNTVVNGKKITRDVCRCILINCARLHNHNWKLNLSIQHIYDNPSWCFKLNVYRMVLGILILHFVEDLGVHPVMVKKYSILLEFFDFLEAAQSMRHDLMHSMWLNAFMALLQYCDCDKFNWFSPVTLFFINFDRSKFCKNSCSWNP